MAVPSSGELRLYADIGVELGVPQSDVSLGSMSDSAGFAAPDAMSDFYGYVDALAPSVTTNAISSVGTTSLRANGNVTSDGGATITERGFYVGTNSASPTNNTKYTVSGTTGSYNRTISVSSNTTYYCWAYATNSAGTTYGSRVQATTIQQFTPTYYTAGTFVTDVEGRNVSGVTANFLFYARKYYVNPYTSALVSYYEDLGYFYNTPNLNYTGAWNGGHSAGAGNYCSNAVNDVRAGMATVPSLYDIIDVECEVNYYPSNSFSSSSFFKSNIANAFIFQNNGNGIDYRADSQTNNSGGNYLGFRFNYS